MDDRNGSGNFTETGSLPFALRLLAHPTTGLPNLSDTERMTLIAAAQQIEGQNLHLTELIEMLRDLHIQCDRLRGTQ